MAFEQSETSEPVVGVRVPCRDGRERVWQASELLRQAQHHQPQPEAKTTARARDQGRPSSEAARGSGPRCMRGSPPTNKNAKRRSRVSSTPSTTPERRAPTRDRKSTRLNSSHLGISYA